MMAQTTSAEGEGWGKFAALVFFSNISLLLGFISVIIALIRWEKCGYLPLLGFLANIVPVVWFFHRVSYGNMSGLVLGTVFCLVFGVISQVRKERGRKWALLAAIPPAVLLISTLGSLGKSVIDRKHAASVAIQFAADNARYEAQIRSDPVIGIRERWDLANDARWSVFRDSFGDSRVMYSESVLKQIYAECPQMRDYLFRNPACSPEFLSAHYNEAYARCQNINYEMLANIVYNTNCPIELVGKVAVSENLPVGAVYPARAALSARQKITLNNLLGPTSTAPSASTNK